MDAVLGVARLQLELARRLGDLLEHELRVEEDRVPLDLLARRAEILDRLVEHELDTELADDPAPAAIEDVHRVLAEDLVTRQFVDVHESGSSAFALTTRPAQTNISLVEQEFQSSPSVDRAAQLLALVLDAARGRARARRPRRRRRSAEEHGLAPALRARAPRAGRAGRRARRLPRRPRRGQATPGGPGRSACATLAEQPMAVLAEETGETINLAVAGDDGVQPRRPDSTAATSSARPSGSAAASRITARRTARCCSPYGAAALPDGPLEALTSRTIVDRRALDTRARHDPRATASPARPTSSSSGSARWPPPSSTRAAAASSPRSACPARRCGSRRAASPSCDRRHQAGRALSRALGHRPEGVHAA